MKGRMGLKKIIKVKMAISTLLWRCRKTVWRSTKVQSSWSWYLGL